MFAASKSGKSSAGGGGTTDPYFPYVPLLLETTSTNGQQNNTFLDSSSNTFTITRNGTPTQGSSTPYWPAGQWSVYFSSSYLSVADSASLRFGASNFTIEAWVYRTASGATHTIACKGASTPTGWVLQISSADKLVFIDTSTSITGSTSLAANTWYYVAVVRAGTGASQTTLYVNGVSDGTGTSATTFNQTDAMRIGTDRSAANNFAGYISNLRLSNTNLTISSTPTTPLTASGSTIFLSCGYNRFVDGALNSAITVGTGTPQAQAFQPFSPAASYTTTLYGGSGYFVASTSDTLLTSSSQIIPTGNFTIELFVYVTSSTATQTFVSQGTSGSAGRTSIGIDNSSGAKWYCQVGGVFVYSSAAPTLNTWNYLAMTYNSSTSTIALYINGTSLGSASNTISAQNAQLRVSGLWATPVAGYYLDGYLSSVRVSNNVRTVTSVPTAPFTDDANTRLLLNMTNAGIYDAAVQNVITTVGEAQTSISQYKWSPTSMKFDPATNSDYLTAIDNPQLQLGTGDFTIDGWVYLSAVGVAYGIISKGTATTGWSVNVTVLNKLQFSYTASVLTGATSLAIGTWYYFAVVRSGSATGNLKIYLSGTADATSGGAVTDNFNQTSILYVGTDRIGTSALNGYLQDVRITKGVGRTITASPTAAFPTR
jgi:hypothetical protein